MFGLAEIRSMNFGRRTKADILAGADYVGKPVKIANNTYRWRDAEGNEHVRLHKTDVVTKLASGAFVLSSGGYETVTTKDRINNHSPARLYSHKGEWFLAGRDASGAYDWSTRYPFQDGMTIDASGVPVGADTGKQVKGANGRWHNA